MVSRQEGVSWPALTDLICTVPESAKAAALGSNLTRAVLGPTSAPVICKDLCFYLVYGNES